jgi:hypothetical protein
MNYTRRQVQTKIESVSVEATAVVMARSPAAVSKVRNPDQAFKSSEVLKAVSSRS